MKIILPTIGTRGDVQPYIALALGLGKAGHNVTLATHPCMRGLVESYGVEFAPMGPDIDIGHEAAVIRANAPHWMVGFMRVMKFSFAMLEQSHAGLLELCRGADLVIVSHSAAGRMEADKLGLPTVSVTLMPEAIPVKDPQAPFLKRAVMGLAGAGMGLLMTRPIDRIRKRAGLPPMGPSGLVHHGGFGTTASGFRAGIPMLVIPHIIDQFIWGNKVAQLGVGPKPIPRPKLNVEHLAVALRQMQSPEMRQKAAALGAAIRAEPDGVAEAVRLIEGI